MFTEAAGSYAAIAYAYSAVACAANGDNISFGAQREQVQRLAASLQHFDIPYSTSLATFALSKRNLPTRSPLRWRFSSCRGGSREGRGCRQERCRYCRLGR